ncbi:FAD/NAD-P-binding domain-containing protein [Mycena filopes]|nr:FAD/NAD-P-binding domain-containing protein [Mycena filopes]
MVAFKAYYVLILATKTLANVAQQAPFDSFPDKDSQWTTFPHPINRVAVIGAGPSGLQAAAHLLAANLTVRLFERAESPGGNWFYTEETPVRETYPETTPKAAESLPDECPTVRYYAEGQDGLSLDERWREHWQPRPVWENLHTNGPSAITGLPGVEYPPDAPWSLSVHDVERHVRAYASLHGLNANDKPFAPHHTPITSYSTRVEAMQKCNATDTWTLTLRKLQWLPESHRLKAEYWTETFDAVVVSVGYYSTAHIPAIKGLGNWSAAVKDGRYSVHHSQSYRHPESYAGKTVLIVGASVSATDIARSIAPFTRQLFASVRPNKYRDAYGLDIAFHFPDEAKIVPEIASFTPLSGTANGISDGKITLVDGTVLSGIDEIILATGYRGNTFLPNMPNPRELPLHWTGHYIPDPTLAYTLTALPWIHGRYQSYALAKVWTGKARLPSRAQMWADFESGKYNLGSPIDLLLCEGLVRLYVAWLNSESLELGGPFVAPTPPQMRETLVYFVNTHWKKDFLGHDNFTRFDDLPFEQWPKPGPDGVEFKVVGW